MVITARRLGSLISWMVLIFIYTSTQHVRRTSSEAAEEAYKYLTGQTEIVVEGNDDKP